MKVWTVSQGLFSVAALSEWGQAGRLISHLFSGAQHKLHLFLGALLMASCSASLVHTQDPATQLDPETSSQEMAEEDRVLPMSSTDDLVAKWYLGRAI